MDKISTKLRSKNMAAIRSSDTSIELKVRRALFSMGFRYRVNVRKLPGCPDILFSKARIVIFIDGCFWHGHSGCSDYRLPKTNSKYWNTKIHKNIERDKINRTELRHMGFEVLEFWQCEVENKLSEVLDKILDTIKRTRNSN